MNIDFQLNKRIKNVKDYIFIDELIFINGLNELYGLSLNNDLQSLIKINADIWYLRAFNNNLYYQTENGKSLFRFDIKKGINEEINGEYYLFRAVSNGNEMLIENGNQIELIDKNNRINSNALKRIPNSINKGLAVRKRKNKIICENIQTGERRWEIEIEEKIFGEIKLYQEIVFISTSEGKLIALNIYNGNKLWEINTFPYPQIDNSEFKLYTIQGEFDYISIDIKSGKITNKVNNWADKSDYAGLKDVFGGFASIYENFIIIPNNERCQIFFLEKDSSRVINQIQLEFPELKNQEPQIIKAPILYKNRLYILDSQETLHIYNMY